MLETQAALKDIFGTLEEAEGFSIDPTFFTRFDIQALRTVVGINRELQQCETAGCRLDQAPAHDRIADNISLRFALEQIAERGKITRLSARNLLKQRGAEDG